MIPRDSTDTIVIGAGVAGLTVALFLQRSGRSVTVIDPLPSPGGASFGNAGMISPDTAVPISLPGMLRQVPGWLLDPLGPLVVKPLYLIKAFPWLMKWIAAGHWSTVLKISNAMRALHKDSRSLWRELTGEYYPELFRDDGQVHIWETERETTIAARERAIRDQHGIASRKLTRNEIHDLFPNMVLPTGRAIIVPGNGYTVSPPLLIRKIEEIFLRQGGIRIYDQVEKIIPAGSPTKSDAGYIVLTNVRNFQAPNVVISAGVHSARLLRPLGIQVPLEAERGYHIMLPNHGLRIGTAFSNKSQSFGVTPMTNGLRVAGTVEISGLGAVPDERRAYMLATQLKKIFPTVNLDGMTFWTGMRPSLPDSLPVVEKCQDMPGLYLNFGHGHFGMTSSPAGGKLLSHMMNGEKPLVDPANYALRRKTLHNLI